MCVTDCQWSSKALPSLSCFCASDADTIQDMTDALRDAELLSEAIASGLGGRQRLIQALAVYECTRNPALLPMYEFSCGLATFQLE